MLKFADVNFNVLDMEKSIAFYNAALDLEVCKITETQDYKIVYLGNKNNQHLLGLTELFTRKVPYNLGDCQYHVAFTTDNYDELYKRHQDMGIIAFEGEDMPLYFIKDIDGYWIKIMPERK